VHRLVAPGGILVTNSHLARRGLGPALFGEYDIIHRDVSKARPGRMGAFSGGYVPPVSNTRFEVLYKNPQRGWRLGPDPEPRITRPG
jgi:hypothetical protein